MRQRRHDSYSSVSNEVLVKYWEMREKLPIRPFIQSGLESHQFINPHVAGESFDAMLQWLAFHASKNEGSPPSVMLNGGADKMWSIFTSNPDFYSKFCVKHVGYVIGRINVDSAHTCIIRDFGGIQHMVCGLNSAFGPELCPTLRNWETTRALNGAVKSISFVGNKTEDDIDDVEHLFPRLWSSIK